MIKKIISGGQTGADRGGLDAAIACGVPHGGWCPQGRQAENPSTGTGHGGKIPGHYQLTETDSGEYAARTEANVEDSDATVIFSYGEPTGGSELTRKLCKVHAKQCLVIDLKDLNNFEAVRGIVKWLKNMDDPGNFVLNIAGSRESQATGIHDRVMDVIVMVLRALA